MKRLTIMAFCAAALLLPMTAPLRAQITSAPDPRLAKKITLDESEITLVDLMKKLSEQTGVKLSVDTAPKQWSVRERKVRAAVSDLPLGELQAALKKLLMYSWKRAGTQGDWEYVLYQSEADRAREAKLLAGKQEEQAQARTERAQQITDNLNKALSMKPDEAAKIKDSDPLGYFLATNPTGRAAAKVLTHLPDRAFERVANGERVTLSYNDMTPPMRQWVKDLALGANEIVRKLDPRTPALDLPDTKLRQTVLAIEPLRGDAGSLTPMIIGQINIRAAGETMLDTGLPEPGTELANMVGREIVGVADGLDPSQIQFSPDPAGIARTYTQMAAAIAPSYSESKLPKDPALLKEVELNPRSLTASLPQTIKNLAADLKLPILCDDYVDRPAYGSQFFASQSTAMMKTPLYKVLNTVFSLQSRTWSKEGPVIVLQDPEWPIKRTWEVPQQWISYFEEKAAPGKTMSVDDIVKLATFSRDQLRHTLARAKGLGPLVTAILTQYNLTNLYGSLNASQKKSLVSKTGLAASSFSSKQWELALAAMGEFGYPGDPQALLTGSRITCKLNPKTGDPTDFTITAPDGTHFTGLVGGN